jgi:hypothetical protein
MDANERRGIEWDCAQNTIRFYNRLDAVRGDEAAQIFAEDGIWYKQGEDTGHTGRADIAAFVNGLPNRGNPAIPPAQRMVFHLVCNLEINVIDSDNAEVRALTVVIPGARGAEGQEGWTYGISATFPTVEMHKRTADGWKIASKRTSMAMRVKRD